MAVEILFDEVLMDPNLLTLGDAQGSPELANAMIRTPGTGVMKVGIVRYDPQHVWTMDFRMVTPSEGSFSNEMDYFNNIWYGGWGSAYGLRVRIETDHIAQGEVLGTSDGTSASRSWKLTRTYNRPGTTTHPYIRYICKPVVNTNLTSGSVTLYEPNGIDARVIEQAFKIFFNGIEITTGWTIKNTTGVLTLTPKTFTADASTNVFTSAGHGFVDTNAIKLENTGGALPAPLVAGTTYYVRDKTTDTFKLAATSGGTAIDITTNGTGTNSISGPPIGTVVSWSGQFDTPMRFFTNSFAQKADFPAEIRGLQLIEMMPAELGL